MFYSVGGGRCYCLFRPGFCVKAPIYCVLKKEGIVIDGCCSSSKSFL